MDRNRFDHRLKRYVNVTTTLGGLFARLAGEKYLGLSIDHLQYAENLMQTLGNLKGPLVKIVQFLSTIPDALPPEYAKELQQLQSNAPPMGWLFVRRRMTAELGNNWQNYFHSFDQTATAAASLGQIHKAITIEGQEVACKLQYPAMDTAIEADLNQLKVAASLYESFNNAIVTTNIQQEISERLQEELNYQKEAKHMEWYHHILSSSLNNEKKTSEDFCIRLPRPLPHLSTKRLLTMTWLEGKPLLSATEWPQEKRDQLARTFFKAWYKPFYHYGIIHGDPHLGNYTIQEEGILNLFDFGCVRRFPSSFIQGVIDLYYSLLNDDESLALKAYEQWGFKNITKELMDILNHWARFLYNPLLEDRIRPIDYAHNSAQGRLVAEEVHKKLQMIGGVSPPKEFVFMDRAAVGVGSVMMHLKAELNWYQLFHELIQGFDTILIDQRQREFQY